VEASKGVRRTPACPPDASSFIVTGLGLGYDDWNCRVQLLNHVPTPVLLGPRPCPSGKIRLTRDLAPQRLTTDASRIACQQEVQSR